MDKKDLTTFLNQNIILSDSKNKFKKPQKKDPNESFKNLY